MSKFFLFAYISVTQFSEAAGLVVGGKSAAHNASLVPNIPQVSGKYLWCGYIKDGDPELTLNPNDWIECRYNVGGGRLKIVQDTMARAAGEGPMYFYAEKLQLLKQRQDITATGATRNDCPKQVCFKIFYRCDGSPTTFPQPEIEYRSYMGSKNTGGRVGQTYWYGNERVCGGDKNPWKAHYIRASAITPITRTIECTRDVTIGIRVMPFPMACGFKLKNWWIGLQAEINGQYKFNEIPLYTQSQDCKDGKCIAPTKGALKQCTARKEKLVHTQSWYEWNDKIKDLPAGDPRRVIKGPTSNRKLDCEY